MKGEVNDNLQLNFTIEYFTIIFIILLFNSNKYFLYILVIA